MNCSTQFYCITHDEGCLVLGEHDEPPDFLYDICGSSTSRECAWEVHGYVSPNQDLHIDSYHLRTYSIGGWKLRYFPNAVYNTDGQHLTDIPHYIERAFEM